MRHAIFHAFRRSCIHSSIYCGVFSAVALIALVIGCGKGRSDGLYSVAGHVRLDGTPLAEASVTFHSDTARIPGLTDNDGRYELKPGAAPGEYRVVIGKLEGSEQAMLAVDPGAIGRVPPSATRGGSLKQKIPFRYSDPMKTELRFTVGTTDTTRADFDLTSK